MVFSLPGRNRNLHRLPISHRRNSSTSHGFPLQSPLYRSQSHRLSGSRSGPLPRAAPQPRAAARTLLRGEHGACFSSASAWEPPAWVTSLVPPGPVSPRHTVALSGLELDSCTPEGWPGPGLCCKTRPTPPSTYTVPTTAGQCGSDPSDCSLHSHTDDAF